MEAETPDSQFERHPKASQRPSISIVRAALFLALAFVVACGGTPTLSPSSPPPSTSSAPSITATAATATAATASAATSSSPALRIVLTDVRSGERFTLGGLTGKTVIVEGMAVW
jgi:hypothetical protein